jgi:hypothetical protein
VHNPILTNNISKGHSAGLLLLCHSIDMSGIGVPRVKPAFAYDRQTLGIGLSVSASVQLNI